MAATRPTPTLLRLGQTIARLRRKAKYSQEGFAVVCGFHRVYMGHVERGEKDLRLSTLERVAKALGLTGGQLLRLAERQRTK